MSNNPERKTKNEIKQVEEARRWALAGYPLEFQEWVAENIQAGELATLAARIYAGCSGNKPAPTSDDWRYWIGNALLVIYEAWKAIEKQQG